MKYLKSLFLIPVILVSLIGSSWAILVPFSENPAATDPVYLYADNTAPYDSVPVPLFADYGPVSQTTFTASDHVYLAAGIDWCQLQASDFITVDGVKYLPSMKWEVWAPGADVSGTPTFTATDAFVNTDYTWDNFSMWQGMVPGEHHVFSDNTFYPNLDSESDLWTLCGGYQEGEWKYRFSIELPTGDTDPWATLYLNDGEWDWYITYSDDLSNAPVTGKGTAAPVPEPGTMLLMSAGLIGIAGLRKKIAS
jgi:hypothetical protein